MKKTKKQQPDGKAVDVISKVKKRLYAYPQLKANIKEYELDIEDTKKELFGRDKSIVLKRSRGGEPLSIEERRAARILLLEQYKERDEREIKTIERALKKIEVEEYSGIIRLYYFERLMVQAIAEKMNCDVSTMYRQKARLVNMLSVILYGADALV